MKSENEETPNTQNAQQEIIDDPNLMAVIALLLVLSLEWFYTQCTC